MLKFEWNSLRKGDRVFVHGQDGDMALRPGVVEIVQSRRGSNDVVIRVPAAEGSRLMSPARLTVHLDPLDPTEECWRCDAGHLRAGDTAPLARRSPAVGQL